MIALDCGPIPDRKCKAYYPSPANAIGNGSNLQTVR